MEQYQVELNGRQISVSNEDIDKIDLLPVNPSTFTVISNHKNYDVKVIAENPLTLLLNGKEYVISIKDEIDLLVEDMGYQTGDSTLLSQITAPMPGLVLAVHVEEGQEVHEGDALLILEAMKMENVISSPVDGIIKSIHVEEKAAIEKGAILIEFE